MLLSGSVLTTENANAFSVFAPEARGKKVVVVGHFPGVEKHFADAAEAVILERLPQKDDYPDSAAEFLIPAADYVFVTSSTLVNKTFPRLLELAAGSKVIMVGPSTPITAQLFDAGVHCLSGFLPTDLASLVNSLKGIGSTRKWDFGTSVNRVR